MKPKVILTLLILVTAVAAGTCFFAPNAFINESTGSCYQGLSALITQFWLIICTSLCLLSLYSGYRQHYKTARVFSCLSFMAWALLSFIIAFNYPLSWALNFIPFLLVTLLVMV